MKSIILVLLVTGGVIACKKDKFTTRPKIEVSSYNTKTVAPQQNLIIQLKFTDKAIKDIIQQAGYFNVQSFNRKFKSLEGVSPGEYRKLYTVAEK